MPYSDIDPLADLQWM